MKKIILGIFIIVGINVFCQENQYFSNDGALSFDTEDYNFNIILVPNLREALSYWNNPDENGYSAIVVTKEVKIDEPIAVLIIFTPRKNIVNLTYNFSTLRPGENISEKLLDGLLIYEGNVKTNVALHGIDLPTIIYRDRDPTGKYQYHLEIYDSGKYLAKVILEFEVNSK
jgi:hypothetical protein